MLRRASSRVVALAQQRIMSQRGVSSSLIKFEEEDASANSKQVRQIGHFCTCCESHEIGTFLSSFAMNRQDMSHIITIYRNF